MKPKNNIVYFNPNRKRKTSPKKRSKVPHEQANVKTTFWDKVGIFISEVIETILIPFAFILYLFAWIVNLIHKVIARWRPK